MTQFLSGRVRGGCRFTQMCNTLFQGLAADGAKKALWDITRECYLDTASPPLRQPRDDFRATS